MPDTVIKWPINSGGLYRCCLVFLAEADVPEGFEKEGARLRCPYCGGGLEVAQGRWQWDGGQKEPGAPA